MARGEKFDRAQQVFRFEQSDSGDITAKTLKDVLDIEKDNAKKLNEFKKKLQRDLVKAQEKALEQSYAKIEQTLYQAKLDGVKDLVSLEAKLRKDAIKEEAKERLKSQNDLYKEELEKIKEQQASQNKILLGRIDSRLSSNKSKMDENEATLALYEKLGDSLTKEQENDKKEREEEQKKLASEQKSLTTQKALIETLQSLTNSINNSINSNMKIYTSLQAGTNARLQGRNTSVADRLWAMSTGRNPLDNFAMLENRLTSAVGINPYFRTESMLTNLSNLINEGISSNVEQRAFLQTASENIATTFDVANAALFRIIRLQQSDSTAARLGMEAYLTRFLNDLVDNTEYLNKTFDSVSEALIEASSHMTTQASTELEYVVQKWLGALVGVGLNEGTATSIAQAFGYLGSGDYASLSGSNLQNLLVMAANASGLDYGAMLNAGINAENANMLMGALVTYMAGMNNNQSNVAKSQLASTFGVTFSDLAAAANILPSMDALYGNMLSYGNMYNELALQLSMIPTRMNTSIMLDTLWENLEFNLASSIASNPALAAIWKVADMIQSNTSGIPIPTVGFMGNFLGMETTVENLLKMGVVGAGSLGMIGDLISGLSTSLIPASTLLKLGILPSSTTISRGSGLSSFSSGVTVSQSAITQTSTGSGSDISQTALTSAKEEATQSSGVSEQDERLKNAPLDIYNYLTSSLDKSINTLVDYVGDIRRDVDEMNSTTIGGKWGGELV